MASSLREFFLYRNRSCLSQGLRLYWSGYLGPHWIWTFLIELRRLILLHCYPDEVGPHPSVEIWATCLQEKMSNLLVDLENEVCFSVFRSCIQSSMCKNLSCHWLNFPRMVLRPRPARCVNLIYLHTLSILCCHWLKCNCMFYRNPPFAFGAYYLGKSPSFGYLYFFISVGGSNTFFLSY